MNGETKKKLTKSYGIVLIAIFVFTVMLFYFPQNKDKIVEYRLTFSKDWNTLTPWSVDGKIVPYFSKVVQIDGPAKVTSYVIGPFLIQVGEVA